jgi:hypothetical protein
MWGKANINTIKEKSKALSDTLLEKINPSSDINYTWTIFKNGCQKIIEDEVPHRQSAQRFNQPWINRDIRRITRLKRRWFRRAKNSNSTSDWSKYKDIKRKAQRLCRSVHDAHISDMLQPDHQNPKVFWNYIKSKKKDNFGVSPLKKDGLAYSDGKQKAELLNGQFTSVFTKEDMAQRPTLPPSCLPTLNPIHVTIKGVQKLLPNLKPHKAPGPNKIPTRLLKLASEELSPGLARLFQLSLDQGQIPLDWKTVLVSPVLKKGNRSSPSNYRPISLTSVSCNILEHIIFSNIMSHLDSHNILSDYQHGFRTRATAGRGQRSTFYFL